MLSKREVLGLIRRRRIALRNTAKRSSTKTRQRGSAATVPKLQLSATSVVSGLFESKASSAGADVELEEGEDVALAQAVEHEAARFLGALRGSAKETFWHERQYAQGYAKKRAALSRRGGDEAQQRAAGCEGGAHQQLLLKQQQEQEAALRVLKGTAKPSRPRGGIFSEDPEIWDD